MIKRIVKMTFRTEAITDFKQVFDESKDLIRNFEGCEHVELLQNDIDPRIFFTFSLWQSPQHLEQYRDSKLFADTWARTKILFDAKPEAWSTTLVEK